MIGIVDVKVSGRDQVPLKQVSDGIVVVDDNDNVVDNYHYNVGNDYYLMLVDYDVDVVLVVNLHVGHQ